MSAARIALAEKAARNIANKINAKFEAVPMTVSPEKLIAVADARGFAAVDPDIAQLLREAAAELTTLRSQLSGITDETSSDPSVVFSAWVNAGPKLALAAGVYVGITVYDKEPTK